MAAGSTVSTPRAGEPWWVRHVEFGAVLALGGLGLFMTRDATCLIPTAFLGAATLRWRGPWPAITIHRGKTGTD